MKNLIIIVLLLSVFGSLAFVQVANAVTLVPFGGRLLWFQPLIATGEYNCPAMDVILSYGGPYKGILYIMVPPSKPKLFYNYYTSGVAVAGNFNPVPVVFNCAQFPIFSGVVYGTSAK